MPAAESAEAVVVGGGPAGAAAALRLARAGVAVTLVERRAGPHHKVCGEFLSATTLSELRDLGLDARGLGAAPVERLHLSFGRRSLETALPFAAASLSRRRLDEACLEEAGAAGARLWRGASLRALRQETDGTYVLELSGGQRLESRRLFIASGKHDLRGFARPPGRQADLIGFKQHLQPSAAAELLLQGRVALIGFPGGYAGLEPVEGGVINLCLLVERRRFLALDGDWGRLMGVLRRASPFLDGCLAGARPCWPKPLAVARLPYGFLRRGSEGPWWLGDQAAVIPSFAGEGLAIALRSARQAVAAFLSGETADQFQQRLAAALAPGIARATMVSRLAVRPWVQSAAGTAIPFAAPLLRHLACGTRIS